MRHKVLSIALGVGLLMAPIGTAFADDDQPPTPRDARAAARQALASWCSYTTQNWSIKGYSSAADMRAQEGNAQTDWWTATAMVAGSPCGT